MILKFKKIKLHNFLSIGDAEIDLDNLLDGNVEIIKNDKGFRIGNLRFAIAWGNGSGLNNPVLRAYIVR